MKTHFFIDRTTGILCLDQHELAALITWDEAGKPYSDVEEAPLLRRYGRVARPDFPHCLAARPPPRGTQLELLTASPTEELTSSVHGK